MLLARTLATIAQAESGKQEEVSQKLMSLIHDVADAKSNVCHKLMGEQFTSQIEVLRVRNVYVGIIYYCNFKN
jgi:hypothetical protein